MRKAPERLLYSFAQCAHACLCRPHSGVLSPVLGAIGKVIVQALINPFKNGASGESVAPVTSDEARPLESGILESRCRCRLTLPMCPRTLCAYVCLCVDCRTVNPRISYDSNFTLLGVGPAPSTSAKGEGSKDVLTRSGGFPWGFAAENGIVT